MFLTRRQFIACSGVALAAPPIVNARSILSAHSKELADLELNLALDASGSVFLEGMPRHWYVQIKGHIYAMMQKRIREALLDRQAYLRIITWSSETRLVNNIFEGRLLSNDNYSSAISVLERQLIETCSMDYCSGTNHSWLVKKVNEMPQMGRKRVLDVSTDEVPNPVFQNELELSRKIFETANGVINCLAVKMDEVGKSLLTKNLCTSGGLCLSADTDDAYPGAIEKKMYEEVV